MDFAAFLPDGVAPAGALALIAFSVITSAVTALLGIGGGVLILIAMTFVIPIEALIAIHGAVQLGSNAGRTGAGARSRRGVRRGCASGPKTPTSLRPGADAARP
ncbi:MAG: hypothetical protein AAF615_05310, partial [Pseudomonadota bacterium]